MFYEENRTSLVCVTQANDSELQQWWESLQADAAGRRWFSDAFPKTYADFVATMTNGDERYALFFNGHRIAGSYWLHDIVDDDPAVPPCAWLRGYVAPTYRGNFTAEAWPVARSVFEAWGYRHVFAASHAANTRAITCLTKNMQFTFVTHVQGGATAMRGFFALSEKRLISRINAGCVKPEIRRRVNRD